MIGRNLSIGDSFTLLINNESYSPFTLNLFNLGGGSGVRTSITTQGISASDYQTCDPLTFLVNGAEVPSRHSEQRAVSLITDVAIGITSRTSPNFFCL
jgi:hypothetical protein